MRQYITIIERALTEAGKVVYSKPTDDGGRFIVVRDPTAQQFNAMRTKARHRLLRMLCHDRHIYCWDGYYADHDICAHYILGFGGGPADIGARLEATSEFVQYGNIDIDLRGTGYSPRNFSAVRDAARQTVVSDLSNLLGEYPQLRKLMGNLPTMVDCAVTFDSGMEFYQYLPIGPLDSF